MNSKFYLLLLVTLFLTFSVSLIAQPCMPSDIVLSSQAEVDAFQTNYGSCTSITGKLTIEGADIANLDSLYSITSIGSRLEVLNNSSLLNLGGLSNVTTAGSFDIQENPLLENLDGLSNVASGIGLLTIKGNDALKNIDGLSKITSCSFLNIWENPSLLDLNGLSNLATVTSQLQIMDNDALINLDGLSDVTSVGGYLRISFNNNLLNIDGLSNITTVGGDVTVEINNSLINIDGLSNINVVAGHLQIRLNQSLTNLDGLSNVTSVGGFLEIVTNASLTNLDGLSNASNVVGYLNIGNNSMLEDVNGLNSLVAIGKYLKITSNPLIASVDGLSNLTSIGEYLLIGGNSSLENINGLANLNSISGRLEISNNDALLDLVGLSNLTSVPGDLLITYNCSLSTLDGLNNISSVEADLIINNNAQTNVDGLNSLISVGKNLTIINNHFLTNLNGLSKLTSIGEELSIGTNSLLKHIDGLSSLTSIGEYLVIGYNTALISLDGLSNLIYLGSGMEIRGNNALTNMNGLSGISNVGGDFLSIWENDALLDIDGLSNLTSVTSTFIIFNNPSLKNLDGLSSLNTVGDGLYVFENNALENIDGLSSLTSTGGILSVGGNHALTCIEGLSGVVSVGGDLQITDNGSLLSLKGLSNVTAVFGNLVIQSNIFIDEVSDYCGLNNLLDPINPDGVLGSITITDNGINPSAVEIFDMGICQTPAVVEVNISAEDTIVCKNDAVIFTATTINGGTTPFYQWQLNGNNIGENSATLITIIVSNGDVVQCVFSSSDACNILSNPIQMTVNDLPNPIVVSNSPICLGDTLFLEATGGVSYNWSGPNGFSDTLANPFLPNITMESEGVFTVTVTDDNECENLVNTEIFVNLPPSVMIEGEKEFCDGKSTDLYASGGVSYEWGTGDTTSLLSVNEENVYSVTVTDINGCTKAESVSVISNPLPSAGVTGILGFCEGGSTTLSANGGIEYEWSTGDTSVTISAIEEDVYTVTVTDNNGCSDSETVLVTVDTLPIANISGLLEFCDATNTTLTANGGSAYDWSTGESTTSITVNNTDDFSVTVTDANGCSGTASVSVAALALPIVGLNLAQTNYCVDDTDIELTGGTPIGGDYSGLGVIGNLFYPSLADMGNHIITYSFTDPVTFCSDSVSSSIYVLPNLPVSVDIASIDTICMGAEAEFIAVPGNGGASPSYQWFKNGSLVGDGSEIFVSSDLQTGDTISCTLISSETCTSGSPASSDPFVVTVLDAPGEPSALNNGPDCEGSDITLSAIGIGGITYEWSGPGGFSMEGEEILIENIQLGQAGAYSVTITNQEGCSAEAATEVIVYDNPTVEIEPSCLPDTVNTNTTPFSLDCGTPAGGVFYCDSLLCDVFDPSAAGVGEHTITYYYTNVDSCSGAFSTTIVVEMADATGEELLNYQTMIFPNPSNGTFTIKANRLKGKWHIKLLNSLGQSAWQTDWDFSKNKMVEVALSPLPKGVYWVAFAQDGKAFGRNIIIQ